MAKNGKNGKNQEQQANVEESKPAASGGADLKPLFAAYHEADRELEQLKKAVEIAAVHRSAAVKAIKEAANGRTSFRVDGVVFTIVARTTRDKTNPEAPETVTYFFKGNRQDVVDV